MERLIEVISSVAIPREELVTFLFHAGVRPFSSPHTVYTYLLERGTALVWVEIVDHEKFPDPERDALVAQKLGGPLRTRIVLNMGKTTENEHLAIDLACHIAERWPVVVDSFGNTSDPIYTAQELFQLRKQGRGFGREDLARIAEEDTFNETLESYALKLENPKLTQAQVDRLFDLYADIIIDHPRLEELGGKTVNLFLLFARLAYRAASWSPTLDVTEGMHRATLVLDLAEQGQLPWPLKPDEASETQVLDGNGQTWDVKSFASEENAPLRVSSTLEQLEDEIVTANKNVILDIAKLSSQEATDLYKAVQTQEWAGKVLWWPTVPSCSS